MRDSWPFERDIKLSVPFKGDSHVYVNRSQFQKSRVVTLDSYANGKWINKNSVTLDV